MNRRNKPATAVLPEAQYQRRTGERPQGGQKLTALQWLLMHPSTGSREKTDIDTALTEERDW